MANLTVVSSLLARVRAMLRLRGQDPVGYSTPVPKRVDAKFVMATLGNEIAGMVESDAVGRRVRVKNTSGGSYPKGTLIGLAGALTDQPSATASNNPVAGANSAINVTETWEAGQEVKVESDGYTDYALVASTFVGGIVVDFLGYAHTAPVVTALPAYEISLADADGALPAEFVLIADIAAGAYGYAFDCSLVTGIDTSAFSAEALLYLSATAGGYTNTAPTGGDRIQQVVGVVKVSHASDGEVLFLPGIKRILKFGSSFLQSGAVSVAVGDITGLGANVAAWLASANSANLRAAVTDETGTGALVFATSPTLVTPNLGTPSAINLANGTGLPATGLGVLSSLTANDIALDDAIPNYDTDAAANRKIAVDRLGGFINPATFCARMTLTTGVPVTPTDVTGASNLYLSPYRGNRLALYDGTRWKLYALSEISLALSGLIANVNYDAFVYDNAGTLTIDSLVPWKKVTASNSPTSGTSKSISINDTTGLAVGDSVTVRDGSNNEVALIEAIVANTSITVTVLAASYTTPDVYFNTVRQTEHVLQDGIRVKSGATTRRYVGYIRTASATTTTDSEVRRWVKNYYNRVFRKLKKNKGNSDNSQDTWPASSATLDEIGGTALDHTIEFLNEEDAVGVNGRTTAWRNGATGTIFFNISETTAVNIRTSAHISDNTAQSFTELPAAARHIETRLGAHKYLLAGGISSNSAVYLLDNTEGSPVGEDGVATEISAEVLA